MENFLNVPAPAMLPDLEAQAMAQKNQEALRQGFESHQQLVDFSKQQQPKGGGGGAGTVSGLLGGKGGGDGSVFKVLSKLMSVIA